MGAALNRRLCCSYFAFRLYQSLSVSYRTNYSSRRYATYSHFGLPLEIPQSSTVHRVMIQSQETIDDSV